jgi:hypothetical protein
MTSIEFAARERIPLMLNHFSGVMAGLVSAIASWLLRRVKKCAVAHDKRGMTVDG